MQASGNVIQRDSRELSKKIERDEKSINIWLESKPKIHICPSCNHYIKRVHDYRTQKNQHIKIGQFVSFLFLEKYRYICTHCGKKFYEHYESLQKYFRKSKHVFENVCSGSKYLFHIFDLDTHKTYNLELMKT